MAVPYMKLDTGEFVSRNDYDDMIFEIEHNSIVMEYINALENLTICDTVYFKAIESDINYSDELIKRLRVNHKKATNTFTKACDNLLDYFGYEKYYHVFIPVFADYRS